VFLVPKLVQGALLQPLLLPQLIALPRGQLTLGPCLRSRGLQHLFLLMQLGARLRQRFLLLAQLGAGLLSSCSWVCSCSRVCVRICSWLMV
jgi:hypothetical protein